MSLKLIAAAAAVLVGCSTPKAKVPEMPVLEGPLLPKAAYFGKPPYKYKVLGVVRTSKSYPTVNLEMTDELEAAYCKKVFAEAARELLQIAKNNGGGWRSRHPQRGFFGGRPA